ncbi:trypsin-like serine protease [Aliikangiella coralliicola]|uniref:Trypsin-like serine protease n=1 Tax=Aliikangiella coralliicola TaxID=2592383 RepID=A0A545UA61_9GAMM|nr:trypsin-like serine protease [Aliikangiella coralliicola]TQV86362.1 trypsin-like serine protease [Aliikangiella coralliicola]
MHLNEMIKRHQELRRISRKKTRFMRTLFLGVAGLASASLFATETLTNTEPEINPNIVGGVESAQGSRSYQAMLLMNGRQGCGGTLIADKWVLTAAHCLSGVSTSNLTVRLGAHYRNGNEGQTHRLSQIIRHPSWSGNVQYGYDVALLELSTPANSSHTRAALPTQAIQEAIAGVGKSVTVSGWGLTSNQGSPSNVLREVDLPVLSTSQCQQQLGNTIDGSVVCGSGAGGKSACNGDSGGPYVALQNGTAYSIGTVSWGRSCRGATAFTRTFSYKSWIEQYIGSDDDDDDDDDSSKLANGVAVSASGAKDSKKYYYLDVPANATNLSFVTAGGSGDVDLYVKAGSQPTTSSYDCRPYKNGNSENCTIYNIQPGTYHVMLVGYSQYSGATLTASYTAGDDDDDDDDNTGCSGLNEWSSLTSYVPGDVVSYNGVRYESTWYSTGAQPDVFTQVWDNQGNCQ